MSSLPLKFQDPSPRLADFIMANMELILLDWEEFARSIWPGPEVDSLILRDSAEAMLHAVAQEMGSSQSETERVEKSRGRGAGGHDSARIDAASNRHAVSRVDSGFRLVELVEEYRALRASVVRLWSKEHPRQDPDDIEELTRFHEGVDQLLAQSIQSFAARVEASREIFIGMLSHDLRSPLHVVTISAHLLAECGKLDDDLKGVALQIVESARKMGGLVHDLLEFSSTRLGARMTVSPARADLGEVCAEVVREMELLHPGREFVFRRDGDLRGMWDAARLRQMISNLLGNAVQHGSEGTPVTVCASGNEAEVRLAVANQGEPIPPEYLPWIFEPMMRVPKGGSSLKRGNVGLGLFIVREVATAHGGSIDVRSDPEGTVFTARLPRDGTAP